MLFHYSSTVALAGRVNSQGVMFEYPIPSIASNMILASLCFDKEMNLYVQVIMFCWWSMYVVSFILPSDLCVDLLPFLKIVAAMFNNFVSISRCSLTSTIQNQLPVVKSHTLFALHFATHMQFLWPFLLIRLQSTLRQVNPWRYGHNQFWSTVYDLFITLSSVYDASHSTW